MERQMLSRTALLLSLSCLITTMAHAGIYKWVDEQGNVHYSQTKPTDQKSKKMKVNTRKPDSSSSYKRPSLKKDKEGEAGKAAEQQQGQAADKQQTSDDVSPQQFKEMCETARKSLAAINATGRVRQRDKDGNVSYLSEEQKQERIKREQERVRRYCK